MRLVPGASQGLGMAVGSRAHLEADAIAQRAWWGPLPAGPAAAGAEPPRLGARQCIMTCTMLILAPASIQKPEFEDVLMPRNAGTATCSCMASTWWCCWWRAGPSGTPSVASR